MCISSSVTANSEYRNASFRNKNSFKVPDSKFIQPSHAETHPFNVFRLFSGHHRTGYPNTTPTPHCYGLWYVIFFYLFNEFFPPNFLGNAKISLKCPPCYFQFSEYEIHEFDSYDFTISFCLDFLKFSGLQYFVL